MAEVVAYKYLRLWMVGTWDHCLSRTSCGKRQESARYPYDEIPMVAKDYEGQGREGKGSYDCDETRAKTVDDGWTSCLSHPTNVNACPYSECCVTSEMEDA